MIGMEVTPDRVPVGETASRTALLSCMAGPQRTNGQDVARQGEWRLMPARMMYQYRNASQRRSPTHSTSDKFESPLHKPRDR